MQGKLAIDMVFTPEKIRYWEKQDNTPRVDSNWTPTTINCFASLGDCKNCNIVKASDVATPESCNVPCAIKDLLNKNDPVMIRTLSEYQEEYGPNDNIPSSRR